jgi:hypothetical protein
VPDTVHKITLNWLNQGEWDVRICLTYSRQWGCVRSENLNETDNVEELGPRRRWCWSKNSVWSCGPCWAGSRQGSVVGCCELAAEQACSLLEVRSRRLLFGNRLVGTNYVSNGLCVRQSKEAVWPSQAA